MILFDTTKARTGGRRRSGLDRVSERLRQSLGAAAQEVVWEAGLRDARTRDAVRAGAEDAFVTSELFSGTERPGFTQFLEARSCTFAAIFHDAIPLKHPHITWPQSVARHPGYMKLLARFDQVFAVSESSRSDLLGFWKWQGIEQPPPVEVVALGADFSAAPRVTSRAATVNSAGVQNSDTPKLLCVGIIEPRKNQDFLLDVCADLWTEGLRFELHLVGRVNPHFGALTISRLKALRRGWPGLLHFHEAASDTMVARLYATTRAGVFPTIAEGCGLPLLESLWLGVPCVCSDLPVLRENADPGGCLVVPVNNRAAWKDALRRIVTDDTLHAQLVTEAVSRSLPTWSDAARSLAAALLER
ncbi:MAG: glycosyltransferase [Opitutaceae bacterium]